MKASSIIFGLLPLASIASAQALLTFPDTATLISGSSEQLNAQYRYSNVGTLTGGGGSFDAILTLTGQTNGASFSDGTVRDTLVGVGQDGKFRIEPSFINESPDGSFSYVEFNLLFVQAGTLTPVVGESVSLVVNDIDSQNTLDYSDVFGIQSDLGGTYTLSANTNLVDSVVMGSQDTYRTFSLDTSTNLSSAPNVSTDVLNFSENQSDYTVQFDIDNVGSSGINFLWGMQEGAIGYNHNNVRTVLIDGTGTFSFFGGTVVTNIPEPGVPILLGSLSVFALFRRRR